MVNRILVVDNNCLDRLESESARRRLRANLRATGRTFWPTATNALEALKSRDPQTRTRLLGTLDELAEDNLAITLPGEGLRRVAMAVHERSEKIDWSEPSVTRLFRHPESVTDEEAAGARDHLLEEERRFNKVHERAKRELRPAIKAEGGSRRWTEPAQFVEDFWSGADNIGPYIEALWDEWGLPKPAPIEQLLHHDAWRLYFDGWGASVYARQVAHPQKKIVQISDLSQLTYLGPARSRLLASDDKEFRELANHILRGRYPQAEVVPLDALLR